MIDGWSRGRRRRRSRGSREAECFHLVGNPVRLPPPDGTHWPPSPTPQPAVSAASQEWKREREETLACVCVWDESAVDEAQTDPTPLTSTELPSIQGAHPGCSVQDDPPCGGDSWWRLQPAELRLDAVRKEQSVNCQFISRKNQNIYWKSKWAQFWVNIVLGERYPIPVGATQDNGLFWPCVIFRIIVKLKYGVVVNSRMSLFVTDC